jgi:hypothetical protein
MSLIGPKRPIREAVMALIVFRLRADAFDRASSQPLGHVAKAHHLLAMLGDKAANLFVRQLLAPLPGAVLPGRTLWIGPGARGNLSRLPPPWLARRRTDRPRAA